MLRSSSTSRRAAGTPSVRSILSASMPSVATNTLLAMLALANARCTVITSTSSSSTSRILSACSSTTRGLLAIGHPGEREPRALADLGLDPRGPAMALDDLAHHRQADAGALDLVAALEGLEQPPDLVGELGRDADPVVGDHELPAPAVALGVDRDRQLALGVV